MFNPGEWIATRPAEMSTQMVRKTLSATASASRRGLLQAGAGLALTAAPWNSGWASARQATPVAAAPGATPGGSLPTSAWLALANSLEGRLILAEDPDYPAVAQITAERFSHHPAGIAVCASPRDAVACVTWARETGTPFAIRSGGHSYAGFSSSSGLVIDVRPMRDVAFDSDAGTYTAGGGTNNADLAAAVKKHGHYFPGGRCPGVGAAGLTLGGGWGFSARALGLTCDHLVSTDLVTASGDLVTASETENPDLFWAVRGGAGGSFGVHTSFTWRTTPTRDVTVVKATWTGGDTDAIIEALLKAQLAAPREFGIRIAIVSSARMPANEPAPIVVNIVGLHWGTEDEVKDILQPVEMLQAASPSSVSTMPFTDALASLYTNTPEGMFQVKSSFVRGVMPMAGIAEGTSWISRMPGVPSMLQESTMVFYCFGGAVKDQTADAMAFPHRDVDFIWLCEALWQPVDDPALVAENLAWLEEFYAAMQPYVTGGAYQNFPDRKLDDWVRAYYQANLERLTEVKRAWDPDNLFRFQQSVPLTS